MRELKFRIWDGEKFLIEPRLNISLLNFPHVLSIVAFSKVIQQFTGLIDKNGKEIYEGDILEFHWLPCVLGEAEQWTGEVYWDNKIGGFLINRKSEWNILEIKNAEIVGNIFENPELLKIV